MGPETYLPLISGFVGALIGAAGPIAVALIQARKDERTHRRDIASRLALADRDRHIEAAQVTGGPVMPISVYMAHHIDLLERLSKGPITPSDMKDMREKTLELHRLLVTLEADG